MIRVVVAMAIMILGLGVAELIGYSLPAALIAFIAGGIFFSLVTTSFSNSSTPVETIAFTDNQTVPETHDLLDGIDEPLLIVHERRIHIANKAARMILGDHIEGSDIRLAIRHPAAAEHLANYSSGNSETITRTELVGLGERERRWEMATSVLKDDGYRLIRLTDRSEAFASEQIRGDFVANASHELRTPLTTLLGFMETLQDEKTAGNKKVRSRFLSIMFDEARRMHQLVDDLISLSRIEAERFTLPSESVDMRPLIDEIKHGYRHLLEEQKSKIVIEGKGITPIVSGDKLQLLQLLQNLILNSLRYGSKGSPVIVRFEESDPEMLRVSVIDQGDGIAPEHLPRLTERFYRVDPGRSRTVGGTGLGLAIVKHIVGRHRGSLNIYSQPGKGTCVQVDLPRVSKTLS